MKLIGKLLQDPLAISRAGKQEEKPEEKPKRGRKPAITPERTDKPLVERSVSMSNSLARGAQNLNLSQKRLLALALAKTDSVPVLDLQNATRNETGWRVRLFAHEYAESYEVDINTAYEQLQTSSHTLLKTLWKVVHEGRKGPVITEGQWLAMAEYSSGEGRVDITFHHKIAPHLLALRSQFTTYKLKQAAALRSIYSWRMFECLRSWQSTGEWRVSIEDFHLAMDAPESCRADFGQLKRRIIDPAVLELKKKDGFIVEWDTERAGRKVIGLVFRFSPDPQGRLPI